MFRHRTGREHATDFRRLPWSARVRTVRTGMQLYAGQEAGKSEMQAVKVNIRGTGFRYNEPRQLCGSMSPPSADGILDLCHRHPISRSFMFWSFRRQWISLCRDCKDGRIESEQAVSNLHRPFTGERQERIIRLLKRVLPQTASLGRKQLFLEPVHTSATRSLVLEVGAEDLHGAYL